MNRASQRSLRLSGKSITTIEVSTGEGASIAGTVDDHDSPRSAAAGLNVAAVGVLAGELPSEGSELD